MDVAQLINNRQLVTYCEWMGTLLRDGYVKRGFIEVGPNQEAMLSIEEGVHCIRTHHYNYSVVDGTIDDEEHTFFH